MDQLTKNRSETYFWRRMKNVRCTYPDTHQSHASGQGYFAHQLFQIFAILPIQASIRLPHPVPARSMLPTGSKENNGIIRFNCVKSNETHIRSAVIMKWFRLYHIGLDTKECDYWNTKSARQCNVDCRNDTHVRHRSYETT